MNSQKKNADSTGWFFEKYSSIENLDQFDEGLKYLTSLIRSIYRMIDLMIHENLLYSGVLNASTDLLWDMWIEAKEKIVSQKEKIDDICRILNDFLSDGVALRIDDRQRVTRFEVIRENIIYSGYSVNDTTEDVERISERYYRNVKKISEFNKSIIPVSLDDSIVIYNLSVNSFNEVLGRCRLITEFGLTIEDFPDVRQAVIEVPES